MHIGVTLNRTLFHSKSSEKVYMIIGYILFILFYFCCGYDRLIQQLYEVDTAEIGPSIQSSLFLP